MKNIFGQEQSSISGYVVDIITKQAVEGVNIIIIDAGTGTTTDSSGFFYFKTDLNNFELTISHISYQTNILQFDLAEINKPLTIQLIYPVQVDRFYELMENCVCATEKYLVFKKPTLTPFLHTYFAVDNESHELIEFISDLQSERLSALKDELKFIAEHPEAFPGISYTLAIMYADQIAYKPMYGYVDIISDTIYYFNHGGNQLEVFSIQRNRERLGTKGVVPVKIVNFGLNILPVPTLFYQVD